MHLAFEVPAGTFSGGCASFALTLSMISVPMRLFDEFGASGANIARAEGQAANLVQDLPLVGTPMRPGTIGGEGLRYRPFERAMNG